MNYKEINKDDFYALSLEEQIKIVNNGLTIEKTLQKVCDKIGVARKYISEKFRNAGYIFSKVDKGFFKPEEIKQDEFLTNNKKDGNKVNSSVEIVTSIGLYYNPSGNIKKMGASVDIEVLKQFEILCNKFNFINTSCHVSNALALYIQTMSCK